MKQSTQWPATTPLLSADDFRRIAARVVFPPPVAASVVENLSSAEQYRRLMVKAAAKWETR